jgi:hypothetical protein
MDNINIEESKEIQKKSNDAAEVSFPVSENQFNDFIISLLGKPQTITKTFNGYFSIAKDDIVTLFEILNQRVFQQNEAKLIQFRTTVVYNDDSTTTLNGLDHLVHYNEVLPKISNQVHLTWQFLIKFRDKTNFEKQEINLSFISANPARITIDNNLPFFFETAPVFLRISHTARSWGADIEAVLSKHLDVLIKQEKAYKRAIMSSFYNFKNTYGTLILCITALFAVFKTSALKTSANNDPVFWLHHYGNVLFWLLSVYIMLKFAHLLLGFFREGARPSFILLTRASEENKDIVLKKYIWNIRKFIATVILSLILSIVGNFIYAMLSS